MNARKRQAFGLLSLRPTGAVCARPSVTPWQSLNGWPPEFHQEKWRSLTGAGFFFLAVCHRDLSRIFRGYTSAHRASRFCHLWHSKGDRTMCRFQRGRPACLGSPPAVSLHCHHDDTRSPLITSRCPLSEPLIPDQDHQAQLKVRGSHSCTTPCPIPHIRCLPQ